jgi:hypothetical protein
MHLLTLTRHLGRLVFLAAACVDAYHLTAALLRGYPVLGGLLLLTGGSVVAGYVRARVRRVGR